MFKSFFHSVPCAEDMCIVFVKVDIKWSASYLAFGHRGKTIYYVWRQNFLRLHKIENNYRISGDNHPWFAGHFLHQYQSQDTRFSLLTFFGFNYSLVIFVFKIDHLLSQRLRNTYPISTWFRMTFLFGHALLSSNNLRYLILFQNSVICHNCKWLTKEAYILFMSENITFPFFLCALLWNYKPKWPVKDKEGMKISDEDGQRNRCMHHFEELLNRPASQESPDIKHLMIDWISNEELSKRTPQQPA